MVIAFLILTGVGRSMVFGSKEAVVLEIVSLFIVLIGWKYSKVFFGQVRGYMSGVNVIRIGLSLYIFLGGWGYNDVEIVSVVLMIGGVLFLMNSISRYVVNK